METLIFILFNIICNFKTPTSRIFLFKYLKGIFLPDKKGADFEAISKNKDT